MLQTLFKNFKIRNYSLRNLNNSIYNTMITQIFIKVIYLKDLMSVLKILVSIYNTQKCKKIQK